MRQLLAVASDRYELNWQGDDAPFVEIPKKLVGLIHVLTFDLDGAEAPSIDELPKWQALPDIDSSIANLHVFADPPHAMTAMQNGQMSAESAALRHPTEAFNALLKLTSAEFPLIEPSNPEVVRKLGLRQIELVSLSLSNLLPPDAYKTTMTDADTGTTPPHNCVSGVIICIPKN